MRAWLTRPSLSPIAALGAAIACAAIQDRAYLAAGIIIVAFVVLEELIKPKGSTP